MTKVDLIYAGSVSGLIILLALFASLGSAFAEIALLFVVGGLLGYGLARLLTYGEAPRWVRAVAILTAAITLSLVGLLFVSLLVDPSFTDQTLGFFDLEGSLEPAIYGFGLVFLSVVFRRVAFPSLHPATREEVQEQKQRGIKNVLIVIGTWLALVTLILVIFGLLALLGWTTALFSN